MLSSNPYCWLALHFTWTPTFVSSCPLVAHNLLSYDHVWAHPCCLTPPQEKNRWFRRRHKARSLIWSRWRFPSWLLRQGWSLVRFIFIFYFVISLPLCNKYSDVLWHLSLYTLLLYMLSSWRMYEMHPTLSLKSGCDRSGIRGNVDCRTKPR